MEGGGGRGELSCYSAGIEIPPHLHLPVDNDVGEVGCADT